MGILASASSRARKQNTPETNKTLNKTGDPTRSIRAGERHVPKRREPGPRRRVRGNATDHIDHGRGGRRRGSGPGEKHPPEDEVAAVWTTGGPTSGSRSMPASRFMFLFGVCTLLCSCPEEASAETKPKSVKLKKDARFLPPFNPPPPKKKTSLSVQRHRCRRPMLSREIPWTIPRDIKYHDRRV